MMCDERYITKKGSVVYKPAVGVRFAVDVIDCVEGVLEALIHSDAVAFCFVCFVVGCKCPVHFCFLVNICQLVFSQRFSFAMAFLFRPAHQRHPVGLFVLSTYWIIASAYRIGDSLFSSFGNALV